MNVNKVRSNFYNNGNFVTEISQQPFFRGLIYNNIRYLLDLPLWLGIPEGEWTPKIWDQQKLDSVSLGPTVTGSYFMSLGAILDSDWGPVSGSRNNLFSGDLLLSDLYPVTAENDVPLLTDSQFPLTLPEDIYGNRVWRGKWATDPETGQTLVGQFRADKEILVEFIDLSYAGKIYPSDYDRFARGMRGYDIGAKVKGSVLAFNDNYNNDFLIMDLNLINMSRWNYHKVYLGIYYNPILYVIGTIRGNELNRRKFKHRINYLTSEYEPNLKRLIPYNLAYHFLEILEPLPDTVNISYLGVKLLQTPFASKFDGKDNDHDGETDESEGEQLGLTGWHYFDTRYLIPSSGWSHLDSPLRRGELIQYKVLSGDTTDLLPIEQLRFFYPHSGVIDPNFDHLEQIDFDSMGYWAAQVLMSTGPFDWPLGDTIKIAFAVVFGDDLENLKANCRVAQSMYDHNYQRMGPPKPQTVHAVAGDRKVTLYWDDAAERDVDFLTGYVDFEGYRIYRTTVEPSRNQWGEQILDGDGKLVGFVPLAQFDLIDGIQGLDSQYPHLQLGRETGLVHCWTDTTVQNGVSYWYAVCAYDRGITADPQLNPNHWPDFRSLENARGNDVQYHRNLVPVTPGASPANCESATLKVTPLPGTKGNGPIVAEVIDPTAITGHSYIIMFDDTTTSQLSYRVIDETDQRVVLPPEFKVHGEEGSLFDGIKLQVTSYTSAELLADSSGWINWLTQDSSACNYHLRAIATVSPPLLADYELRFTETGDTSVILGKLAPFEVWNISAQRRVDWEIFTNAATDSTDSLKRVWSSGDIISVREWVKGAWRFAWQFILSRQPTPKYTERDTVIDGYQETVIDTIIIDNAPAVGDAARIVTTKPFHSGDRFALQTKKVTGRPVLEADLSRIKVVPNPYVVAVGWELHAEDHRLAFTHLPVTCEIVIYTIAGEVVAVLKHDDLHSGTEFWNLQSHEGMEIASGLYLYVVRTPEGKTKEGKFVVIR